MAKNFVRRAMAKRVPETIKSFSESLRIACIPTNRQSKLKNRHCTSIRKLLESTSCHGVEAKRAAASKPVVLPYKTSPILYTKMVHPRPNKVIRATPLSNDEPKILKNSASM